MGGEEGGDTNRDIVQQTESLAGHGQHRLDEPKAASMVAGRAADNERVRARTGNDAIDCGNNSGGGLAGDIEGRAANVGVLGVALRVKGDRGARGCGCARGLETLDVFPIVHAKDVADVG